MATTTQARNKTGRINWKRAKRNLETNYGLRLGILNVGTLREKEEEITLLMEQRNLKILGISETREKITGKRTIHNDYVCLSSGDPSGKHGVAFIVTRNISNNIDLFKPVDNRIACMKLRLNNIKVIVVTVYAPQQGRPEEEKEQFYQKLQHEIDSIRTDEEVIVMGDLNGHIGTQREGYEQVMGYHGIGSRNGEGERVLDFCNVNHMKIMNTFFQHRPSHQYTWYGWNNEKQKYDRQTQIDLFLTTNHRFVTNTKAIPSVSLDSDHRLVVMNTKYKYTAIRPAEKKKRVRIRELNNSKENRRQFQQCLTERTRERDGEENANGQIEEQWTILKGDINASIEGTIGFKWSSKTKRKQTAWWTDKLRTKVKEKQRLFRQFMKQRTPAAREAYVKARREADACKRSSKAESWNRLCEDLEFDVNGTKKLIYQLANSYRKGHKQKPFNIKAEGSDEVLTEPHEIKECWTNYFSSLLNVQQHQELTTMSEPTAVVGHKLITEHEVESAVKRSKSGKAPGCDIIPNEVYKAGEHEMVRRLTAIFNQAYREGCVPTEWGQAEICPIYKQKGDYLRCENYRGVSLMSHACKLYESVLECRLRNIVEERLGPWQHGFRKGVGTTDMIWALRLVIEKHWEYNQPLFIAFLDLEKAFDRVPREKLWMAMAEYMVPADLQIAI